MEAPEDQNDDPIKDEQVPRSSASILIIDDEETVRNLLSVSLSSLGYSVLALEGGREALEQRNLASFDLLLVDVKMPNMNGIEFMQTLTTRAPEVADRVVFITGDTINPATQEFLEMTGRPVLTKPFDLKTLRSKVAETLRV